eukprot:2686126-Lingulodinium_polyedra.AAC.1
MAPRNRSNHRGLVTGSVPCFRFSSSSGSRSYGATCLNIPALIHGRAPYHGIDDKGHHAE